MKDKSQIREEICTIGSSLYARRYTVGTAGDISTRLDDGWLITPTDACPGRLDPEEIAKVTLDGQHVSGGRPSKTPCTPGLRRVRERLGPVAWRESVSHASFILEELEETATSRRLGKSLFKEIF
ncbi:aldolase [Caballeronia udeis]|uniref:Aldolase n=1 Tax=Caballeronia udeis TaxID=1232866 RepID=A0A158K1X3_9BURK|nr:aldolase [Caballeronia udeis]